MRRLLPLIVLIPLIGCNRQSTTERKSISEPPPPDAMKQPTTQKFGAGQIGAKEDEKRPPEN